MPDAEPATALPTIQQRIDADYLATNFDTSAQARISGLLPRDVDDHDHMKLYPSAQLREFVRRGAGILHSAHQSATPIERLGREAIGDLVRARHALTEVNHREVAVLDQLEDDPPVYLVAAIGRPTPLLRVTDGISRRAWRELAGRIEAYRLQYGIVDPTRTLGPRMGDLTRLADRSRVATDIAWCGFALPGRTDPGWLEVFGPPDQDPADALDALQDPAWRSKVLPPVTVAALQASPSAVLRRHANRAVGILRHRPPDPAHERTRVEAVRRQLSHLADQPPTPSDAIFTKVQDRIAEARATLDQLDLADQARLDWDAAHTQTMAIGQVAARELRRREVQVLLQVAKDPPAYLTSELGNPGPGAPRLAWLAGARAIIAYRTTHQVDTPQPLGPTPTDDLGRIHNRIAHRLVDDAKHRLAPRELEPPQRPAPRSVTIEPLDVIDFPG